MAPPTTLALGVRAVMSAYVVAGLTLVTSVPLPEMSGTVAGGAAWRFDLATSPPVGDLPLVHQAVTAEGTVGLRIEGDGQRYLLRFAGVADFVVTPAERAITCTPGPETGPATVRHLLLDHVVPHILALDGSLVLHASAVVAGAGAVAFVGPSGAGKSSLAAGFVAGGATLVSDDFIRLVEAGRGFAAVPTYPGVRLWPDSAAAFAGDGATARPVSETNAKRRVVAGTLAPGPAVPLRAIVLLGDPAEEVSVRPVPARDAMMALYPQAFRVERSGRERQVAELDRFTRLVTSTALLRAGYPRDYTALPAVRAAILEVIGNLP